MFGDIMSPARQLALEVAPNASTCTNLTDLGDDCLELLFGDLKFTDLLNVADSSKLFSNAAGMIYRRKYSHTRVVIDGSIKDIIKDTGSGKSLTRHLFVGKSIVLKFLRNFGHLVRDVHVYFHFFNADFCKQIERYLAKYCSESLYSLSMSSSSSRFVFEEIDNQFKNIDEFRIDLCTVGRDLTINKRFPKLRVLCLGSNSYKGPENIRVELPSVKDLSIQARKFDECDLDEFFKLNPQLTRLEIHPDYSLELIRSINNHLPNLNCLVLRFLPFWFFEDGLKEIHFDNIHNLALHIGKKQLHNIPIIAKNLRNFLVFGSLCLNQQVLNFFGNIPHVKSLTIHGWTDEGNNINKFFGLENILQNLEELNIEWVASISVETILGFLRTSRSIKKLTINLKNESNDEMLATIDAIKSNLTNEWEMKPGILRKQTIIHRINV